MSRRRAAFAVVLGAVLGACGRGPLPAPAPGEPAPAPAATAGTGAAPAAVDAIRVAVVGVRVLPRWPRSGFPWVARFQDARVTQKVASPDGRRLAWRGEDAQGYWLYVAPAGGGPARRLDACRNAYQVVWSPDSRRLLYSAMDWRTGRRNLEVYDLAEGRVVVRAFEAPLGAGGPGSLAAWTPDGSKIVFTYHGDLWIMNADGIGRRLLDLGRGRLRGARRIGFSADGTRLAYQPRRGSAVLVATLGVRP